jgi:hypothetical protein
MTALASSRNDRHEAPPNFRCRDFTGVNGVASRTELNFQSPGVGAQFRLASSLSIQTLHDEEVGENAAGTVYICPTIAPDHDVID